MSLLNQERILDKVDLQDSTNFDYQGKKHCISMECWNSKHKKLLSIAKSIPKTFYVYSEKSIMTCKSYGDEWHIRVRNPGSIVCSTVHLEDNCRDCDVWRLLVWKDGVDEHWPDVKDNTTLSGHYYCGYYPKCEPDYHVHGGVWMMSNSSASAIWIKGYIVWWCIYVLHISFTLYICIYM